MKAYLRHRCHEGLSVLGFRGSRCPHCGERIGARTGYARASVREACRSLRDRRKHASPEAEA